MKNSKVLFDDGTYRTPTQGDLILNQAIKDMSKAVSNRDFFEAVKQLGIIELFKTPELPFYTGMVYMADSNFEKVVEYFSTIPETSHYYSEAMSALATAYGQTGRYILLDTLLKKHCFELSPISELCLRLNCLQHMEINDFTASDKQLSQLAASSIEALTDNKDEWEDYYHICRMFVDMLVIAGECMNQCGIYKDYNPDSGFDFESYPETSLFAKMYRKCVNILSYSKYLKFIRINNDTETLAVCALSDKTWDEKLRIFRSSTYVPNIVRIVFELCRPERHPFIPAYSCLEKIMECYSHMASFYIDEILEKYFDIISKAAIEGVKTARDYMGLSYSRIQVTEKDPCNIKKRLDVFMAHYPAFSYEKILENTELNFKMSREGHDALVNAEYTFAVSSKGNYGVRDASNLALVFFRVFEIEYNNRLIIPFAKILDFTIIKNITEFCKQGNKYTIDDNYSGWGKDLECLFDLQNEKKESLEIGVIRTLIAHILHRTDPCARYLLPIMKKHLTKDGINALNTERMVDVIGVANVKMYRNPGAHTGYVSYSKACEARDYVKSFLPEVESWFLEIE